MRLANHCRRILVSSFAASVLSSRIARVDQRYGKASRLSSSRMPGRGRGREPDDGQHAQMCGAEQRLEAAGQRLVGQHRIEVHRRLGHADALMPGRDRGVQVGQRFGVIEPGHLGHEALDQLEDAVGAIDEAAQQLSRASTPLCARPS